MGNKVFIATTSEIPGYEIDEIYGLISVSIVTGVSYFKEVVSSVADFFGGSVYAFEEEISSAKRKVEHLIRKKALRLGMNAVVQCKYDVEPITHLGNTMFMISLSGTAINLNGYEVEELEVEDLKNDCDVSEIIKSVLEKTNDEFGIKKVIKNDTSITPQKIYEMDKIKFEEFLIDNKDEYIREIIEAIEIEFKRKKAVLLLNYKNEKLIMLKKAIQSIDINNYKDKLFRNLNMEKALMIRYLEIIDYGSIYEEFIERNGNEFEILYALETIPTYIEKANYVNLIKLVNYLEDKYNDDIKVCKKDRFSNVDVWLCRKCNTRISMDEYKCPKCFYDRYGIESLKSLNGVGISKSIDYRKTIFFLKELVEELKKVYEN